MFTVNEQFSDYQLTCQDMYDWGGEIMVIKWGIVLFVFLESTHHNP